MVNQSQHYQPTTKCNGASAGVTEILESTDFQSFNNLANKQRFRILMDRTVDVNVPGMGGDGASNDILGATYYDSFYQKVNIPIEFDSTTGAITEVKSNNIGVLAISQTGSARLESKMRLRFSDL